MFSSLRKANTVMKQFRPLRALATILLYVVRGILDPQAILVYGRAGEDRLVEYVLSDVNHGFYVDVGCNHPRRCSNTMRLYTQGWRGLCIDANGRFVSQFRRERPQDICVEAAISSNVREMKFVEYEDDTRSSLSGDFVERAEQASAAVRRRLVTTRTLTSVLDEHAAPLRFDLLTVDCEGHDYDVLLSLDFGRYRPRLIIVEIHDLDLERCNQHRIYRYLKEQGYRICAYGGGNAFFIADAVVAGPGQ